MRSASAAGCCGCSLSRVRPRMDLSLERIESAAGEIDPVFLDTPQFVSDRLSDQLGHEVLVKIETLNPIGSFKGRGTSLLGQKLDPSREWVCETAGNFGQGLAYATRKRDASLRIFVPPAAPEAKVKHMRDLGAEVEVDDRPVAAAAAYAAADDRILVVDGLDPATAEGAGTIGVELTKADPVDTAVIQLGDGALISGIAPWLKERASRTRIVGVGPSGAPGVAGAQVAGSRGVLVEPAGAAGVAALSRHPEKVSGDRVAVLLTGAAA